LNCAEAAGPSTAPVALGLPAKMLMLEVGFTGGGGFGEPPPPPLPPHPASVTAARTAATSEAKRNELRRRKDWVEPMAWVSEDIKMNQWLSS
jgi:hypothetical protein